MAGFLSKVFEPQDDGGNQGQSNTTNANGHADADVEVTVALHTETGVEYQTEDESGGWSSTNDVGLTLSADALVAMATEAGFGEESASE